MYAPAFSNIDQIKTVKIPYCVPSGKYDVSTIKSLADGVSTKLFLLSAREIGFTNSYAAVDGALLSYFASDAQSKRTISSYWWTRTPVAAADSDSNIRIMAVYTTGSSSTLNPNSDAYKLINCVVDYAAKFDPDTMELITE